MHCRHGTLDMLCVKTCSSTMCSALHACSAPQPTPAAHGISDPGRIAQRPALQHISAQTTRMRCCQQMALKRRCRLRQLQRRWSRRAGCPAPCCLPCINCQQPNVMLPAPPPHPQLQSRPQPHIVAAPTPPPQTSQLLRLQQRVGPRLARRATC